MTSAVSVVRELGAKSAILLEGLGRTTNFGTGLVGSMLRPPSRFGLSWPPSTMSVCCQSR